MAWGKGSGGGGCLLRPPGTAVVVPAGTQMPTAGPAAPCRDLVSPLKCSQQHLVPASEPRRARGRDVVLEQMPAPSGYLTSWGHSRHPSG